jgi:hypothetical protein
MTTKTPFKIDVEAIGTDLLSNGNWHARFRHPITPTRMGLAKWVSALGSTPDEARDRVVVELEKIGGVRQ